MRSARRLLVRVTGPLLLLLGAATLLAADKLENQAFQTALTSITSNELGHHVDVLADDTFEGRQAGSRGGRAAGGYLADAMNDYGISPAGVDGGFFQPFGNGYRNVLGMMEGSDPKLKHQFILVGAHYDHVGYGSRHNSFGPTGYIHNGADDNASGTSGVLEIMQAFATLPHPPRHSILFAFWDGEEMGLLGSKHFVQYPTVPLTKISFAINMDMIGRMKDHRVEVYGARTAGGLRSLVSRQNSEYGMELDFVWDVLENSDHFPFYQHDIPFLMLHTGLHENYHRPSDDAELINRDGLQEVAQLAFRVAYELAEMPDMVAFRGQARFESNHTRSQFERVLSPTPPRLGIAWAREDQEPGLLVTRVAPGSPAEQAGLEVGDRIEQFAGRRVDDGDAFKLLVLAATSPATAVVRRPGTEDVLDVPVQLAGSPIRVGISWQEDRADPSIVVLTRVVVGSAAEGAGLAVHDRIYSVDGETFAGGDAFGELIAPERQDFTFQVERAGRLRNITVHTLAQTDDGQELTAIPMDVVPAE